MVKLFSFRRGLSWMPWKSFKDLRACIIINSTWSFHFRKTLDSLCL